MALDKQKILSELGSVMNKLQSADCGCMGKMFSNQGQYSNQGGQGGGVMGSPLPTCGGCRRGCCHGYGGEQSGYYGSGQDVSYGGAYGGQNHGSCAPCAGEPHTMHQACMGMQCNPPKLYADTYNYLSHNLMQPVVKEVYDDLKSINPNNSVMNNPMASQIGLQNQSGEPAMQGNMMAQNQMPGYDMGGMQNPNMTTNQQMGYQIPGNQQTSMGNQQFIQGMGPNIVNMMQGDGTVSKKPGQPGQLTSPINAQEPQSVMTNMNIPGGKMPQGQYNSDMNNNASIYGSQQVQSQYNVQHQNMNNTNQNTMSRDMQQNTGYMQQSSNNTNHNTMSRDMQQNSGYIQQNPAITNATYKVNYSNPAAQQMKSGQQNYGQHTPGVTKFNEMFPGVMQGMGGDLGFDPMTIAIQMNPANQQQAATNQMTKLMTSNNVERVFDPATNAKTMQPAIVGANTTAAMINQAPTNQQPTSAMAATQQISQGYAATAQPNQAPQPINNNQVVPQTQQQVYTAQTGAPTMTPQHPISQEPQQYQHYSQVIESPNLPTQDGSFADPSTAMHQLPPPSYDTPESFTPEQKFIKDPIFPADSTRNQPSPHKYQRSYEYNTLGQPIEMQPTRMYHRAPDANPQQTLSPQPVTRYRNDLGRFNIKNTVSKTSLMGSRPVGRTPSRGQLQHVYNQYKGSHSYTQQNIRTPATHGASFSEGKLNVALADVNQHRRAPVERIGGDTLASSQMTNNPIPIKGQPMSHTGDTMRVDLNKPHGDVIPVKEPLIKKSRNGLQDMVYTSYPTSAAWSFHGNNERQPYSPGNRIRNRI